MAISAKKVERWAKKKKTDKLLKALKESTGEERGIVVKALGTVKDENTMYALIPFLRDPDKSIRIAALDALGAIGNGRSIEFVKQVLETETDPEVRTKTREAIEAIKEAIALADKM